MDWFNNRRLLEPIGNTPPAEVETAIVAQGFLTEIAVRSIEFKRQVAQEFLAGESLHGLSRRHDVSRNLIRVWVAKLEAGTYDEDAEAADLLQEYEAKIAALERLVGRQALEIEFLKGALKSAPRPRSATTSVIAGPMVSPSPKDAD